MTHAQAEEEPMGKGLREGGVAGGYFLRRMGPDVQDAGSDDDAARRAEQVAREPKGVRTIIKPDRTVTELFELTCRIFGRLAMRPKPAAPDADPTELHSWRHDIDSSRTPVFILDRVLRLTERSERQITAVKAIATKRTVDMVSWFGMSARARSACDASPGVCQRKTREAVSQDQRVAAIRHAQRQPALPSRTRRGCIRKATALKLEHGWQWTLSFTPLQNAL